MSKKVTWLVCVAMRGKFWYNITLVHHKDYEGVSPNLINIGSFLPATGLKQFDYVICNNIFLCSLIFSAADVLLTF